MPPTDAKGNGWVPVDKWLGLGAAVLASYGRLLSRPSVSPLPQLP
jgi:hypothetical protein